MQKFNIVITLMALGLLVGCARTVWIKPGASQQDFISDQYSCERDMRQSGYYGEGFAGSLNMKSFFNRCMNAHGWFQQKNAPTTTLTPPTINKSYDKNHENDPIILCAPASGPSFIQERSKCEKNGGHQDPKQSFK